MAADDDDPGDIEIVVDISGQEGITSTIEAMRNLYNQSNELVESFNAMGLSVDDRSRLQKGLTQLRSMLSIVNETSALALSLNATANSASRVARAVDELDIQKLIRSPALIRAALDSTDIERIATATAALERTISTVKLRLQELENLGARADGATIDRLNEQLARTERQLTEAQTRSAELAEQAAVLRNAAGRERSAQGAQVYSESEAGQQRAAEREAAAALRRAQAQQQAQDAAFLRQQDQAEREDFARQPESIAARKTTAANTQADVFGIQADDDESVDAAARRNIAAQQYQERVKARQAELNPPPPPPPPEEPEERAPRDPSNLFAFQARIQAQYILLNSLFTAYGSVQEAIIKFDNAMKELAATSGASNEQLETLRTTILDVSTKTPFSAGQLAEVSRNLATKGIGVNEVNQALPNIANLASATGSTLDQSGEIFSSAFENFKLRGGESSSVADQFTVALNKTRLSATNFDQALQAVQETAKENNLTLAQTTAALGGMAQEGLRSGSLLGTGLRQVLIDLEDPPKKLADRFRELGLSQADLDVSTNGFVGVLDNLKNAGFTAADAFTVMSGRQAQAFAAALNGTGIMKQLYTAMLDSTGAAAANAERMDSLENQWKKLGNTMLAIGLNATRPVVDAAKEIGGGLANLVLQVDTNSKAFSIMGTVMASIAGASILTWVTRITGLMGGMTAAVEAAATAYYAMRSAAAGGEGILAAGLAATPVGWIALAAAIGSTIVVLDSYGKSAKDAAAEAAQLKDAVGESSAKVEDSSKAIDGLNAFIDTMTTRQRATKIAQDDVNNAVAEARNKFGDLSSAVYDNITSYGQLISKLKEVRAEVALTMSAQLAQQQQALNAQKTQAQNQISYITGPLGVEEAAQAGGYDGIDPASDAIAKNNLFGQFIKAMQDKNTNLAVQLYGRAQQKGADVSPDELSSINTYGSQLATNTITVGQSNAGQIGNDNAVAKLAVTSSDGYGAAEDGPGADLKTALDQLSKLGDTVSVEARKALYDKLVGQINGDVSKIKDFANNLQGAEAKTAFGTTDLNELLNKAAASVRTANGDVTKAVSDSTVSTAKVTVDALTQKMSELEEEMRTTKVGQRGEIYTQYVAAVNAHYDAEVKLTNARFDGEKKAGTDIDNLAARQQLELQGLADQRRKELLQGQAIESRTGSSRASPNREILGPAPANVDQISNDLKNIDTIAAASITEAGKGLAYAEAYLNTEKSTPGASEADIKLRTKALADARKHFEEAQVAILAKQIADIKKLIDQAQAELTADQTQAATLLKSKNVTANQDGSLSPSSLAGGSFANSQERDQFKAQYDQIYANEQKLINILQTLKDKGEAVGAQLDKLGGQVDARNSVPAPTFGNTFQNTVGNFQAKEGVGENSQNGLLSYTNEAQTLNSVLEKSTSATANFFSAWETGGVKGAAAFKQFAASIIKDMLNIINQKLAAQILGLAFSSIGSALGGGSSSSGVNYGDAGSGSVNTSGAGTDTVTAYHGRFFPHHKNAHPIFHAPPHGGLGFNTKPHKVLHFSAGGLTPTPDIGRDSYPALLAGGEAVLNSRATSLVGENTINALNAGMASRQGSAPSHASSPVHQEVNVYVMDKSAPPQSMGPKDVIATIGEDLRNNGATKKLIQQIVQGA